MHIFREIEPLKHFLNHRRQQGHRIGLVATMGALHRGHDALIAASQSDNDLTVCSIYVNPTQFNDPADLENYPRDEESDMERLTSIRCDVAFLPTSAEMYTTSQSLAFDLGELGATLEGKYRPGHFSGVALVVAKLFNIVAPHRAYFGQKDYQQFKVVSLLREELRFPLSLCSVPTVREPDGLALSSRNRRLSTTARVEARCLFESLSFAQENLGKGTPFSEIRTEVVKRLAARRDIKLDYFALADCDSLASLEEMGSRRRAALLIAAHVGGVRLIDNLLIAL